MRVSLVIRTDGVSCRVVQKMRDDGKDVYDIRKQEEVLQVSPRIDDHFGLFCHCFLFSFIRRAT